MLSSSSWTQLVNSSFEICSAFPSNTGQWQVVDGWNNAGSMIASPDYFHYLGSAVADLPETPVALVDSYDGDAVMGLIAAGTMFSNIREYVTAVFDQPMEEGKDYLLGFKITNGYWTPLSNGGLACSDLGLYFSTSQPVQTAQFPLMVTPQFSIDTVLFSRDWVHVNMIFHADQNYQFMTFGLFGDDSDKEIILKEGDHPQFAYYFLDDFFIEEVPANYDPSHQDPDKGGHVGNSEPGVIQPQDPEHFFVPNTFTPNDDGNNDEFQPITWMIKEYEFSIYSRWGELLFFTADESKGWNGTANAKRCENGAFVWEVSYITTDEQHELVRKEIRGVVNLVR
ncbi:MAG: gliding motility-associated C-terminal domain-containing protein [Flavobacteriales bacterium]|nr:gliding motility-associated C-terminal domain-containing protein [Flavobacteriales bacterium]